MKHFFKHQYHIKHSQSWNVCAQQLRPQLRFDLLLDACKFKERWYLKAPPTCCSKHLFVRGSQSGGEKTEAFKGEELKWLISVGELKSHTRQAFITTARDRLKKTDSFNTSNHLLSLNMLQWKDTVLLFHVQLGGVSMSLLCYVYVFFTQSNRMNLNQNVWFQVKLICRENFS